MDDAKKKFFKEESKDKEEEPSDQINPAKDVH
jgi:hypothetical protein